MKNIQIGAICLLICGCVPSYLDRHQMKIVHNLYYSDGWPNGTVIARAIEVEYEDQNYSKLNEFVKQLYGNCMKDDSGSDIQCEFELQCIGGYSLSAQNVAGIVKGIKVKYSDIICD